MGLLDFRMSVAGLVAGFGFQALGAEAFITVDDRNPALP